ncbi:MAG: hypothetical protein K2X93_24290 [Candidatus Obscuribacterales bacterium]|nr:hypothetical protein [Candidatus Obscuribacterales bacterium]
MISGKTVRKTSPILYVALAAVCFFQQGCGSGNYGQDGASKNGTINVEGLKVGVPETVIKDAVLTFVLDEQQAAKSGGRNQYLSRTKDSKGGQFSAQCKDGSCFRLEAIYADNPITKEQALETLAKMLPTSATAPVVREGSKAKDPTSPTEKYDCGDVYVGELIYLEPTSDKVRLVAAIDRSKLKKDNKEEDGAKSEAGADATKAEAPKEDTKTE